MSATPTIPIGNIPIETHRTFLAADTEGYENLKYLIRKYGCAVDKVSDDLQWIRVYFAIRRNFVKEFLNEEQALGRDQSETTTKV